MPRKGGMPAGHKVRVMVKPKHQKCFDLWYTLERSYEKTAQESKEKLGFPVHVSTVRRWADQYGWMDKAAKLDEAVERKLGAEAVQRQAAMIRRHSGIGRLLQQKGMEHYQVRRRRSEFIEKLGKLVILFNQDPASAKKEFAALVEEYGDKEFQFKEDHDATSALKTGIDIERNSEGLPTYALEVLSMSDEDAYAEYRRAIASAVASAAPPANSGAARGSGDDGIEEVPDDGESKLA